MADQDTFHREIEAATNWLLDARPIAASSGPDGKAQRTSRWGWLQDVRPSSLNTAEALIALHQGKALDRETFEGACSFAIEGLEEARCTARHAGWIALALQRFRVDCPSPKFSSRVESALHDARQWLATQQSPDGGWGDMRGRTSVVPTTALVIEALGEDHSEAVDKSLEWLRLAQARDGGWPLAPESADRQVKEAAERILPVPDAKALAVSRRVSNPACTAFAMLALTRATKSEPEDTGRVQQGAAWLHDRREPLSADDPTSGGWPVFRERGIHAGESYTFRHFSTAWAMLALVEAAGMTARDREILEGLDYLLSLQEPPVFDRQGRQIEGGGWKCSRDGEPYTWATGNAISVLCALRPSLDDLRGTHAVDIRLRERRLEELDVGFVVARGRAFALNKRTVAVVATVLTAVAAGWVWAEAQPAVGRSLGFVIFVVAAVFAAAPWAVLVGLMRDRDVPDLRYGAGVVYGVLSFVIGVIGAVVFAQ
jgi:hypothetical protein